VNILADLNAEQRAAAEHDGGALLVVAGAGTGKTFTHRVATGLAGAAGGWIPSACCC
jgi:DNA helicase-2/ATP-dependent DNA helicase PcrA